MLHIKYNEFSQLDHWVNSSCTPDLFFTICIELLVYSTRVLIGVTGFLDFVHRRYSKEHSVSEGGSISIFR
jgi:hypothetical protein